MKMAYDKGERAVLVIAHLRDFDGDVQKWKDAFYELWRHQLTWSFAYSLNLNESRANGVYVDLTIKPSYRENLLETMESLGYRNVQTYATHVGIVDSGRDDVIDIDLLVLD